jgi:hypothetical protein
VLRRRLRLVLRHLLRRRLPEKTVESLPPLELWLRHLFVLRRPELQQLHDKLRLWL